MHNLQIPFFVIATIFSIAGYVVYYRAIKKNTVSPNRWSWIIWAAATLIETLTYHKSFGGFFESSIFYISSIACITITVMIWRIAKWEKPDFTEIFSVIACITAMIVWYSYQIALWAHVVMLVALPVAFIPTIKSAWGDYRHEDSAAWKLWSIGDLFCFLFILTQNKISEELYYIIIEFFCHFAVFLTVFYRKRFA